MCTCVRVRKTWGKLNIEVFCDLSSLGGIYNHQQRHSPSGVGSGPWEQLPIPIAPNPTDQTGSSPDLLWSPGLLLSCLLFSFMGPVLLIVCEYLHMLTVYRFWLWVVKLLRTHHSSHGTHVMIYQMKNVIQMSAEVRVGAAQSAINNMDKKWLFQYVISSIFCKA